MQLFESLLWISGCICDTVCNLSGCTQCIHYGNSCMKMIGGSLYETCSCMFSNFLRITLKSLDREISFQFLDILSGHHHYLVLTYIFI